MITINVLQSEHSVWQVSLGHLSDLPLSHFRGAPRATRLAQRCAMAMGAIEKDRNARLQILQRMFNLSVCPTSTYDLTVAQAYALRQLAYTEDQRVSDDFITFAESLKDEHTW